MARTFVKTHIDLPTIEADIAMIEPPTITVDEVLDRLAPSLVAAHRKGVTAEQLRDRLKAHKITVSVAAITAIIEGKSNPRRKPRPDRPAASATPRVGLEPTPTRTTRP